MPLLILTMLRAGWALRRDSQVTSLALLAVIAIISGTGFYSIVEGLRFVDALYFSVVTLTTVGYGDFAPQTDAGKLFTAVYVLVGVGIVLAFITTVAAKASQMPLLHAGQPTQTRRRFGSTSGRWHDCPSSADSGSACSICTKLTLRPQRRSTMGQTNGFGEKVRSVSSREIPDTRTGQIGQLRA